MVTKVRLAAVFTLNMAQGMPASFFAIGLPALLRESGATLDVVAMSYLVWAPWALKWLWGSSLDSGRSLLGRIGRDIVWLPPLTAGCFLILLPFPPSLAVWPIFAVGLACSFISATLQMALSRWIVHMEDDERRRALLNSVQVAGMTTGAMIGGSLVVFLSAWLSWAAAIAAVSLLVAAASLPFLLTKRGQGPAANEVTSTTPMGVASAVAALLHRPGVVRLLLLMLFSDLATGSDILLPALLVDAGYDATTTTFLLSTLAMVAIVPSSLVTGSVLRAIGTERVFVSLLLAKALVLALLGARPVDEAWVVASLGILSMVITAVVAITYLQIYMRVASIETAASDIAILTSIRAIYLMAGAMGGGFIASHVSYAQLFWTGSVLSLAAAGLALGRIVPARGARQVR
ncbi:MFS transporter [Ensifer adhaerens]|uniref:MFS transporter n=1 Tax=Ensifer adhaerens TaxID=106592 RepID=UPI003CFD560F